MRIIVTIILVILVLSSVLLYLFRNSGLRDHGEGLYITDTNRRLLFLSIEVKDLVEIHEKKRVPKDIDKLIEWIYSHCPNRYHKIFDLEGWIEPETDAFIDAWGNPIELKVNSLNEYTFISAGPNQQFEDGKGDDITYSFNPYAYKEEEKQKEGNPPMKNSKLCSYTIRYGFTSCARLGSSRDVDTYFYQKAFITLASSFYS